MCFMVKQEMLNLSTVCPLGYSSNCNQQSVKTAFNALALLHLLFFLCGGHVTEGL